MYIVLAFKDHLNIGFNVPDRNPVPEEVNGNSLIDMMTEVSGTKGF